jgi:uncharacterized protein (DUF1786 family)
MIDLLWTTGASSVRILVIDIGTGTQDILVFDSKLQPENCFKLVLPSPTMIVAGEVKRATRSGKTVLLTGTIMGGGPSHWAVRDHSAAGLGVFATAQAATTFDDELEKVQAMGIQVVDEGEALKLARSRSDLVEISLGDLNYPLIVDTLRRFGVAPDFDGVAVAVFDHGNAPPGVSDRQFRFDYLDHRIKARPYLSAFGFTPSEIPSAMTRLQAVMRSAQASAPPQTRLMVMDTAPAAAIGATCDPVVASQRAALIVNVGNFHTLAFRLGEGHIDGLFEHHTGFMTPLKLDRLLTSLADSTLRHEDVYADRGHGALVYNPTPFSPGIIAVTGPRRAMMAESSHETYLAVAFGDMMIAGCWGMIRTWAGVYSGDSPAITESLYGTAKTAPWD